MTPLLLNSPGQFRPAAPPALTSATYTAEFDEVKALGAKASAQRTPAQTETVQFLSSIGQEPIQAALRDLATRYEMDISDRARLFAAVDMSVADAIIACWDSKFHYGLWRPITAIQLAAEDGNPATAADPAWEPLLVTPPYPDYISGLNSVMGALTRALTRVLGTHRIDLTISSPATNTTRYYEFADRLCADAVDARVWGGIHFRTADVLGQDAGPAGRRLGARPLLHAPVVSGGAGGEPASPAPARRPRRRRAGCSRAPPSAARGTRRSWPPHGRGPPPRPLRPRGRRGARAVAGVVVARAGLGGRPTSCARRARRRAAPHQPRRHDRRAQPGRGGARARPGPGDGGAAVSPTSGEIAVRLR